MVKLNSNHIKICTFDVWVLILKAPFLNNKIDIYNWIVLVLNFDITTISKLPMI